MRQLEPLDLALDDPMTRQAAALMYDGIFNTCLPTGAGALESVIEGMIDEGQQYYGLSDFDSLRAVGALILPQAGARQLQRDEAFLDILVVHPDDRDQGLGGQVLQELEEIVVVDYGLRVMRLSPFAAARKFYARHGYQPYAGDSKYYSKQLS
jgi:GNAT superfamily N-acetyltransferase